MDDSYRDHVVCTDISQYPPFIECYGTGCCGEYPREYCCADAEAVGIILGVVGAVVLIGIIIVGCFIYRFMMIQQRARRTGTQTGQVVANPPMGQPGQGGYPVQTGIYSIPTPTQGPTAAPYQSPTSAPAPVQVPPSPSWTKRVNAQPPPPAPVLPPPPAPVLPPPPGPVPPPPRYEDI